MKAEFDVTIDISEYEFSKQALRGISANKWVKDEWPVVYFIKNETEKIAYIGESADANTRIKNHIANPDRAALNKISIIGSEKFNKSATLDIESKLIQYIFAEGSFKLQNANNGLTHHTYYQKNFYEGLFKTIWQKLIERKIVSKTIQEIQNSDFFKYSPYKSLSPDQMDSVLEILTALNKKNTQHVFVNGRAGTGKTVLATYLIKLLVSKLRDLNHEDLDGANISEYALLQEFHKTYPDPSIGLVVPVSSLRATLQKVFNTIPGLHSSMVISPSDTFKRKYDVLLIDESHRLRRRKAISWMGVFTKNNKKLNLGNDGTEIDWLLHNSTKQIFFYDHNQSVKPSDIPAKRFNVLLNDKATTQLELISQLRIQAGPDYIPFIDNLLDCTLNKSDYRFSLNKSYELKVFDSFADLHEALKQKEEKYKLSRMVSGYSWAWKTKKNPLPGDYDIELDGIKLCWNKTDKDWIGSKTSFEEVGCIHTTQGYDLNYAGIIFGREIKFNPVNEQIEILPEYYFDKKGKEGITNPEELKKYLINIYKTNMLRGAFGTYLYVYDENLREYFKKQINEISGKHSQKPLITNINDPVNKVPFYNIQVAAGTFSETQRMPDLEWIELPHPYKADGDYFVCKVSGNSMNKKISDGALCLFKKYTGGSREGKIVLAEHFIIQDPEFGSGFTIKLYHSTKEVREDNWMHTSIILKPLSTDSRYQDIIINPEYEGQLKIIGIFVDVLKEIVVKPG